MARGLGPPLPDGYGGWTTAAKYLSGQTGVTVSRQQVWMWHYRRARNGFPELHPVTAEDGSEVSAIDLCEAAAWLAGYWQRRNPLTGKPRRDPGSSG